jgi:hypothetical protein
MNIIKISAKLCGGEKLLRGEHIEFPRMLISVL